MKKKFSLWLNIVTICLCVCAIAIGVYAATSATLQVTGQIGFTAHGLEFTATAKAKGYAESADADTYIKEFGALQTMSNNKITLPDMYFTDLAEETIPSIEIVISITNNSQFNIYGVVSATSTETNIGIDKSVGLFNLDEKGGTKATIDITITLSVIPETDGSYTAIEMPTTAENLTISIDLNKGTIEENLIKQDTTNNYYYLEMGTEDGTANGTPLRWYAFAYKGTEATTYGSASTTAVTNLSSGSYYFISEKALLVDNAYHGVVWGPYPHSGKLTDNYSLDYGTSLINPLVNGQATGSVYNTYGMSSSPIYNAITNRTLAGEEYTYHDYDNGIEPTYTTHTTYNQTLWLLSDEEAKNTAFFADNNARKAHPVGGAENDYAYWWLRSPNDADSYGNASAWAVRDGGVNTNTANGERPGVRPAFQINMSV